MCPERNPGRYQPTHFAGESVRAFVPAPLPPEPPLDFTPALQRALARANQAIGRLDGLSLILPDTTLFLYIYIRKEAVLSSQIEGTQSSLSDLLVYESHHVPGVPIDDVEEVVRYVQAIEHGLKRVREDEFPISSRLLCEVHERLLSSERGKNKSPGEFRRSQNWIGGTRPGNAKFVPPPPDEVGAWMSNLERFIHDEFGETPTLIKAALAHLQFETIHPFLDGNGRLGRLLVTLLLCVEGVLAEPLLYLSLYLKEHKQEYYRLLQDVRETGDWESWVVFFLTGVERTAGQAVEKARQILRLFEGDREKIQSLGRSAGSALRVHTALQRKPVASIGEIVSETGLTPPTVGSSFERLSELGLIREVTGQQRNRLYVYQPYVDLVTSD
jgi:Fic family protein